MKRPGEKIILIAVVALLAITVIAYYLQRSDRKVTQTHNPQLKTGQSTTSGNHVGGITDNNSPQPSPGINKSTTPTPAAVKANPSIIVISIPVANQLLSNGSVISGTSSSSTVNYRIIDDSRGMLTTGQLNVSADQKFSGTVQNLKPYAKTGYIEFFNADSSSVESNNVTVKVTF